MKKSNIATGLVFMALGVFAYVQGTGMVGRLKTDTLGPGFWPKTLGIAMCVLSLVLIASTLFGKKDRDESGEKQFDFKSPGFRRVVSISALMVVFGALIYFAGIYVAMIVMLPLCMLLHGERNPWILLGITVGMALFVYLVFGMALKVPLPQGKLFS